MGIKKICLSGKDAKVVSFSVNNFMPRKKQNYKLFSLQLQIMQKKDAMISGSTKDIISLD